MVSVYSLLLLLSGQDPQLVGWGAFLLGVLGEAVQTGPPTYFGL